MAQSEAVITCIRRPRRIPIPHGNTVLLENDRFFVTTLPDRADALRCLVKG